MACDSGFVLGIEALFRCLLPDNIISLSDYVEACLKIACLFLLTLNKFKESWTGILLRICWNLLVAYFGFYCFSAGIKRELNAARKKVGGFNRICNFFFVIIIGRNHKQLISCRSMRDVIVRKGNMRRCSKLQIVLLQNGMCITVQKFLPLITGCCQLIIFWNTCCRSLELQKPSISFAT